MPSERWIALLMALVLTGRPVWAQAPPKPDRAKVPASSLPPSSRPARPAPFPRGKRAPTKGASRDGPRTPAKPPTLAKHEIELINNMELLENLELLEDLELFVEIPQHPNKKGKKTAR